MLGQGTVGLELEDQAPDLDTLLVAVGGGGLIGGIAAWFAGKINIVGVEPETAPTLLRAFEAGQPVDAEAGGIAADSLAPRRVGELVFPIAREYVSDVVLVTDDAIRKSQEALWKVLRRLPSRAGPRHSPQCVRQYHLRPQERVGLSLAAAIQWLSTSSDKLIRIARRRMQGLLTGIDLLN